MPFLGLCKDDPLLKMVRETFHANPLRIPEARVRPYTVFAAKNHHVSFLGTLSELMIAGDQIKLPPEAAPDPVADIRETRSRGIDLDAGMKILKGYLEGLLRATGNSGNAEEGAFNIKQQFTRQTKASFQFSEARRDYVNSLAMGAPLKGQKIDRTNPAAAIFFGNKGWKCLIVDSVFVSPSFTMFMHTEGSSNLGANIPALKQLAAELGFTLKTTSEKELTMSFAGPKLLTFAFTCSQAYIAADQSISMLEPGVGDVTGFAPAVPKPYLLSPDPAMIELDEMPVRLP